MSILTKVFVVLLTLLSIALSMFTVAALAKQENYRQLFDQSRLDLAAESAKAKTATANARIELSRAMDRAREDGETIASLQTQLDEQARRVAGLQNELAAERNKVAIEQATASSINDQNKILLTALNSEKEFNKVVSERNSKLERNNIDLSDRVKELTANLTMADSRIRALREQIASMTSGDRVATQIPGGPGVVQADTPSVSTPAAAPALVAPIRGEVTAVKGDIASISVGSADGVGPGMKFLLFRSSAAGGTPTYLGTLRITKVQANESVGTIEQSEADVRIGDSARDEASLVLRS